MTQGYIVLESGTGMGVEVEGIRDGDEDVGGWGGSTLNKSQV
jgi:hypothetical protein